MSSFNKILSGLASDVAFQKTESSLIKSSPPEKTFSKTAKPSEDDDQDPGPSRSHHESHLDKSIVSIEEFIGDDEHNTEDNLKLNSNLMRNQQSSLMQL